MKKLQIVRLVVQVLFLVILFTPFAASMAQVMMLVMLATMIGGAFYCGWMCPMGTLNDITGRIAQIFGIKRIKLPQSVMKYARFVRYAVLALLMAGITTSLLKYDARKVLLDIISGKTVGIIAVIIMVFFLVSSLFIERLFCNFFCYEGAKYGLLSLARVFLIKRDKETCINCKKCTKSCPMNIPVAEVEEVRDAHCVNCFNCVSECPKKGAIKYGITNFKKLRKIDLAAIATGIAFIAFIINMMSKKGH